MKDNHNYVSYTYVPGVKDFEAKEYAKKSVKSFFSKLGNSLTLVVEVLPFAGLFAAIGGILMGDATNQAMYTAGLVCANIGQTVLNNLGLLFMFSIILGFTNAKGFSIYSSLIGYIAFIGFILPFIRLTGKIDIPGESAESFNLWYWKGLNGATQLVNPIGLGVDANFTINAKKHDFIHFSFNGIKTLNTGVLGGVALGFIYSLIYNKTKDLKLPAILSFFEGEKFTSVICLLAAPIIASLFIMVWPAVNIALSEFGRYLAKAPYGLDSLFFGLVKYWLLPFQAHAAFYAPLWWTDAGGALSNYRTGIYEAMIYRTATNQSAGMFEESTFLDSTIQPWIDKTLGTGFKDTLSGYFSGANSIDDVMKNIKTALPNVADKIHDQIITYDGVKWNLVGDQTMSMELVSNNPGFDLRDAWSVNLKVTRFISGGYANLMFATPAIGFAMWGTLPEDRRKKFFPLYWGAVVPCLILGVSEPIMFMFAFIVPGVYFLWYVPFYAILFWIGSIFQVKMGSTFSQGMVDYVINGIIPTFTKHADGVAQTKFWEPLVMGAIAFPIAYYLFKLVFIKYDFAAPGSVAAEQATGTEENTVYKAVKPKLDGLLEFFGKKKNIKEFKYDGKNKLHVVLKNPVIKKSSFIESQYIKRMLIVDDTFEITLKNVGPYMKQALQLVERLVITNNLASKLNTTKAKAEAKLNSVKASWIIKEEKLDYSTPEKKIISEHTKAVWEIKHERENALRKAQGLKPIPFSEKDKELLKQENISYKKQLQKFDKKKHHKN